MQHTGWRSSASCRSCSSRWPRIGRVTPSRPTRQARPCSVPSGCLAATMKALAPGCEVALVPPARKQQSAVLRDSLMIPLCDGLNGGEGADLNPRDPSRFRSGNCTGIRCGIQPSNKGAGARILAYASASPRDLGPLVSAGDKSLIEAVDGPAALEQKSGNEWSPAKMGIGRRVFEPPVPKSAVADAKSF